LVTKEVIVSYDHRVVTKKEDSIWLCFYHLVWSFNHLLKSKDIVVLVTGRGLPRCVKFVAVVYSASAMTGVSFALRTNIWVFAIQVKVKSLVLARIG